MNEIALANFYRVLNDADRFPKEKQLAEAAIAAKDELNALRALPLGSPGAEVEELDGICRQIEKLRGMGFGVTVDKELEAIGMRIAGLRKHVGQPKEGWVLEEKDILKSASWWLQHFMRYAPDHGDTVVNQLIYHLEKTLAASAPLAQERE